MLISLSTKHVINNKWKSFNTEKEVDQAARKVKGGAANQLMGK